MGALGRAGHHLGHDKVLQFATAGVTRAGDREDVVTQPVNQQSDIVGQGHDFITGGTSSAQRLRRTMG
jgi:hypothetical protein